MADRRPRRGPRPSVWGAAYRQPQRVSGGVLTCGQLGRVEEGHREGVRTAVGAAKVLAGARGSRCSEQRDGGFRTFGRAFGRAFGAWVAGGHARRRCWPCARRAGGPSASRAPAACAAPRAPPPPSCPPSARRSPPSSPRPPSPPSLPRTRRRHARSGPRGAAGGGDGGGAARRVHMKYISVTRVSVASSSSGVLPAAATLAR